MGSAISPAGFRGAADMRFAIDRLCGPTALASFGVNQRDTVDLEENLGLLHNSGPPGSASGSASTDWSAGAGGALASSRFFRDLDLGLPKLLPLGKP